MNPIYDEMADRRGVDVPENPDWFTPAASRPEPEVDPDQMPPEHQHAHGGDG